MKPPVPGSTLGNRLPCDVMGLFKTHINSLQHFASVNGCYAQSAIAVLAFHLATVIAKMCVLTHFRHSAMTRQSGDSSLPFSIWQCMIKEDTKKALST